MKNGMTNDLDFEKDYDKIRQIQPEEAIGEIF